MNPFTQPVDPAAQAAQMEAQRKAQQEAVDRLKNQVVATFGTPHGEQLLNTLMELYVHRDTSPPGAPKGYGYVRHGENSMVLMFRRILLASKQVSE